MTAVLFGAQMHKSECRSDSRVVGMGGATLPGLCVRRNTTTEAREGRRGDTGAELKDGQDVICSLSRLIFQKEYLAFKTLMF